MAKKFATQVNDIVLNSKARVVALVRMSVQDTVKIANTPTAKGGKMRVDTGFLRASGRMSLTGVPTGPIRPPDDAEPNSIPYSDATVIASLGKFKLGMTIFYGWTANYARYRELYDGFLATAMQQWPQTVSKNIEKLRKRVSR